MRNKTGPYMYLTKILHEKHGLIKHNNNVLCLISSCFVCKKYIKQPNTIKKYSNQQKLDQIHQ